MTEIQIGDVVYLDEEFCWDATAYHRLLEWNSSTFKGWSYDKITSAWLLRTKWIITEDCGDYYMAVCPMFADKPEYGFEPHEIVLTGERIIPNDPSRYDRMLL